VTELESRRLIVFVRCRDRTMTGNYQEVFFKFNVTEDEQAPKLISEDNRVEGDIAKISFKIDEAAECRESSDENQNYDDMNETIICRINYDSNNQFYYQCDKDKEFNPPEMTIYTKCADRVPKFKNYTINIIKAENDSVIAKFPNMINYNQSRVNITSDYVLAGNSTTIISSVDELKLNINFRRKMNCKYSIDNSAKSPMMCNSVSCQARIPVANESVNIECASSLYAKRNINEDDPFVFVLKK
jgi:hypothetical protein